jgi:hypothetical protein
MDTTIYGFDSWNWSLSNTTPFQALVRRVFSILPISIGGNNATSFYAAQINVKRTGFIGAFRSSTPPKAAYAKSWNDPKNWLNQLTPENSRLSLAEDRLQILFDAFNKGPPIAYVSIQYGPNIAVSVLFFKKDFEGPLNSKGSQFMDEWRMVFCNTLRNQYCISMKIPFMHLENDLFDSEAENFIGVVRMKVADDELRKEDVWTRNDECGVFFLSAVGNDDRSIIKEFLGLLENEKKKAIPAGYEGGKEAIKDLLTKINYFVSLPTRK